MVSGTVYLCPCIYGENGKDPVMSGKMKWKIAVDILMTLALLVLMSYGMAGEAVHEWTGMGMFVLFILHHILNRSWTANLGKGRYTSFRIL